MDSSFLQAWNQAALTSVSFFWKALWAFVLGYIVSSCIQVFVTRERMRRTMGGEGAKGVGLGTFFGFLSSSCSFAALATTKSLFGKGAGFSASMAFLLASTNLVIELGFIIALFLSWQFVAGEYLGGLLLILIVWLLARLLVPEGLVKEARERVAEEAGPEDQNLPDWRKLAISRKGWTMVARQYAMEWNMVWKDVTIGFTLAGVIAAFVPHSFFQTLFQAGQGQATLLGTARDALIGPVAAFFTFIGSMGNIPLAAILYQSGVSFAGIMAFIFSDLVVFPVIRINARYYGWRMALTIVALFLAALVAAALALHWGFAALGLLPEAARTSAKSMTRFPLDYGFFLNLFMLAATAVLAWLLLTGSKDADGGHGGHMPQDRAVDAVLRVVAVLSYVWLAGGLLAGLLF